ncbi:MAG: hypothetical protein KDB66_03415 [Solirubrobacterales bacterium]|nr:hypothetical protein [Solirubrobacterales bacterium]
MAETQVRGGIGRVVATPHVSQRFPNQSYEIEERRSELTDALAKRGISLRVEMGAEVAMTAAMQMDKEELMRLRLGGGAWLLLEPPSSVDAGGIQSMVGEIRARGHQILLAHPERIEAFQRAPEILKVLVASGVKTQVTASALIGRFGSTTRRFAKQLFDLNLVSVVASDAHDARNRAPGLEKPMRSAGFKKVTTALCRDEPTAILDGAALES